MPPLPDSILGLFPPLGVSGVSHDSPAGIHPFTRRVTRPLRTPDNAYDTLSVQCIGADCDPEPPLVKAEMWFMNSMRTSIAWHHANCGGLISQLYDIVNTALLTRVFLLIEAAPIIPRLPLVTAPLRRGPLFRLGCRRGPELRRRAECLP
jgi:hypothetical protein